MTKRHLKVTGDLGRVVFVVCSAKSLLCPWLRLTIAQEYDLRNTASIEASVRHSDVVYNLVGRDYPTKLVACSINTMWLSQLTAIEISHSKTFM